MTKQQEMIVEKLTSQAGVGVEVFYSDATEEVMILDDCYTKDRPRFIVVRLDGSCVYSDGSMWRPGTGDGE